MLDLLKLMWRMGMFDQRELRLADGRRVQILSYGTPNKSDGDLPEFFGAGIRFLDEDLELHGSIKVDINSVDWYFQKTVASAQFDNVILHVVTNHDAAVMHNNRIVPTLILPILDEIADYRKELAFYCKEKFSDVDSVYSENFVSRLFMDRIERKSNEVLSLYEEFSHDWDKVGFIVLTRAFGYGDSKIALEKLSKSVSLYALYANCTDLLSVEALLFGACGYLDGGKSDDTYKFDLQQRHAKLCQQYKLPRSSFNWHPSHVRPVSMPHYLIARVAAVFYNNAGLISKLIKERNLSKLQDFFRVDLSPYWLTHSNLGVVSGSGVGKMTKDKIDLLLINGVVPLLYAYGSVNDDSCLQEWSLDILGQTQERNSKVRQWEDAGYVVKNGYYSQALIQMNDVYCRHSGCASCPFGSYLLHKRYQLYCKVKDQL